MPDEPLAVPCVLCRDPAETFVKVTPVHAEKTAQRWAPICHDCSKLVEADNDCLGWCADGAHAGRRGERCRVHDQTFAG